MNEWEKVLMVITTNYMFSYFMSIFETEIPFPLSLWGDQHTNHSVSDKYEKNI